MVRLVGLYDKELGTQPHTQPQQATNHRLLAEQVDAGHQCEQYREIMEY